jgi:type I restriction enzyme S subunit
VNAAKQPIGTCILPVDTWNPSRADPSGEFTYVDLGSIDQSSKIIISSSVIKCADAPSRARQRLRYGDVLVSTVRPNLNAVAMVGSHLDGATGSTGFSVLRPNPTIIIGAYLFHWVKSLKFIRHMVSSATGASYPAVSDRIVRESLIPLPPLVEQRRIAEILDKADEILFKRKLAITKLDQLMHSVFVNMFGDVAANLRGWPVAPLRSQTDVLQTGPFGTQLHKEDYIEGGIPLVNPTHITNGKIVPDRRLTVSEKKYKHLTSYQMQDGDVVMGRRGEMGRCAPVTEESDGWLCGTGSIYIRPTEGKLSNLFLSALLSSPPMRRKLESVAQGVTMPNLNTDIVGSLEIIVPPYAEQLRYENALDAIAKISDYQSNTLERYAALSSSLQHSEFAR